MLVVLDNCEHVIEAAAALAVEVLNAAPGVQIPGDQPRAPARRERAGASPAAAGEPAPIGGAHRRGGACFPAVQLFVERAAGTLGGFELDDEDAPLVADICRRLDGVPLAIELAAARIDAFGVRGLAAYLDDALQLLTGGRRPARPQHQSLRANLDWGHDLLREQERVVLRRLAIFAGGFTLEPRGGRGGRRYRRGGGRRVRRQPGHEVADCGGHRWRATALPPARDDAGLRAREALRERRARGGEAPLRRALAGPGRRRPGTRRSPLEVGGLWPSHRPPRRGGH